MARNERKRRWAAGRCQRRCAAVLPGAEIWALALTMDWASAMEIVWLFVGPLMPASA